MTEGDGGAAAPVAGKERRLKLFLIVSLAFNLLVVGAVAGSMLTWRNHGPWHGGQRGEDYGLLGFSRTLEPERRNVIGKAIRQQRLSLQPLWREMHEARREAADVLGAEPFSRERLEAAIDKITGSEMKLKSAGLAIFLNMAERLTADERRALGEWWRKKSGHHFGFRHKEEKTPPPDDTKADAP